MIIEKGYEWFMSINSKVTLYPLMDYSMIFFAEYVQYAFVLLMLVLWWKQKKG